MTENQAIERMKYRIKTATDVMGKGVDGKAYEDMEMAIAALQEIQKYRTIGTVEECRENKNFLQFLYDTINPNEMEQYLSIYHATDEKSDRMEMTE